MKIKISSLCVIIKVFDIITYLNTFIKNQQYISLKHFHKIIIKIKKVYQDFI